MSDTPSTFRARRGKQAFWGVTMLLLGIGSLPEFDRILTYLYNGGKLPGMTGFCVALACPLFFSLGVIKLFGAAARLPSLTIDRDGIQHKKLLGVRKVAWDQLAPFKVTMSPLGYFYKPVVSADSYFLETRARFRKKGFIVHDDFHEDIGSLAERLNETRRAALGSGVDPFAKTSDTRVTIKTEKKAIVRPWLTCWIFLFFCLIYLYEILFAPTVAGAPSLDTLVALGAVGRDLVFSMHQWYRIITAPLLHANLRHLIGNGIALFFAGMMLEGMVGRIWFSALFVIGAVGGSLMSMAMNEVNMASVGASGAIMSLFGVLFMMSFRVPQGHERRRVQYLSMRVFIPVLLPLTVPAETVRIDGSAHLGGLITGLFVGLVMLRVWRRDLPFPPYERFAKVVVKLGAMAVFVGILTMLISDQHACADYSDETRAIKACTAMIESKQTMQVNALAAIGHLSELYGKNRQFDLALEKFNQILALNPDSSIAFLGRGLIYAQARRNEAAIEDYSRAETLTQDNDLRATINGDRANVYFGAGDFDEASKNLQAALRFDPKNVYALSLLGNIDLARGDYGQAKADLNHALKFESDNDQLLWVRGEAEMYGGDVLAAVKDMQKSVSLSHDDGHKILWMHIVRVHAKQADGQEFDRNSEQADADLWPNSLLRLYRGTGTAEQVVAQAKIGDLLLQSDQLCEAHFYIGEWEYEHGNMGAARSLFQEASDDCPKDFIEYSGARAELRAMNFKQ